MISTKRTGLPLEKWGLDLGTASLAVCAGYRVQHFNLSVITGFVDGVSGSREE